MKIQLIDFGGRSPESAHANDAGADVYITLPTTTYTSNAELRQGIIDYAMQYLAVYRQVINFFIYYPIVIIRVLQ